METEFICENCGNKVIGTAYYEECYFTVEKHYECPECGFRRNWAYGNILPGDSEYKEN